MENIGDANRNDIGWPAEIILAKLVKSLTTNIFVESTQMLEPVFLPAFITVEKNLRIKEIKEEPLLKQKG